MEYFKRSYELSGAKACLVQSGGSDCFADGERCSSINSGDHPGEMVPWNFTGQAGWAQVNGRDDILIPVKVEFDEYYLTHRSFAFDLYIILLTVLKVIRKEGVQH